MKEMFEYVKYKISYTIIIGVHGRNIRT